MVVREDDPLGLNDGESGDNQVSITSGPTSGGNSEPDDSGDGYVIELDTVELTDTAIKSIVGGIATGLVVNKMMEVK